MDLNYPSCQNFEILLMYTFFMSECFLSLFCRTSNIGVWYNVLCCMVAVSMLTNTVIMGFSSEQLAEWLPWMYETIDGDQYIKLGYGR